MASTRYYLDIRRVKKDGRYPVKMSVRYKGERVVLSIGLDLRLNEWSDDESLVVNHSQKRIINAMLLDKRAKIEGLLARVSLEKDRASLSDIRKWIEEIIQEKSSQSKDRRLRLDDALREYMGIARIKPKTIETFEQTILKVNGFDDGVCVDDVDRRWLERFDDWMAQSLKTNARGMYMRNIRTVFNYLLDDERINKYPFRKFKIKTEETAKRSLSVDDMRSLIKLSLPSCDIKYRDLFVLSFLLRGINPVDLLNAKPEQVISGRLEYNRSKTGKHYSVKIEPEAMSILERYRGVEHLIDVLDYRSNYDYYTKQWSKGLKLLGTTFEAGKARNGDPLFPHLSTYWARHSWATIAHSIGISKDIISLGLGHSFGARVTDTYIDYDMEQVDDANRKVIDWVYYEKK